MMAGAMPMERQYADIPEYLIKYRQYPLSALNASARAILCNYLNPKLDSISPTNQCLQDWRGVAECWGFTINDVYSIECKESPMMVLMQWFERRNASTTIEALLQALCYIERYDILNDDRLQQSIGRNVENYCRNVAAIQNGAAANPVQDDQVGSTSDEGTRCLTVTEVDTGIAEYFDAFVCCTQQDGAEFIPAIIHHLEDKNGFKLFIADRDLIGGAATYVDLAKLIKERCRKMIIVLSPNYLHSDECAFATRFAQSLDPSAGRRMLIPIKYQDCKVPNILNFLTLLDYTRTDIQQWFWARLASSLRAPQISSIVAPSGISRKSGPFTCPVSSNASVVTPVLNSFTAPAAIGSNEPSPAETTSESTSVTSHLHETPTLFIRQEARSNFTGSKESFDSNSRVQNDSSEHGQSCRFGMQIAEPTEATVSAQQPCNRTSTRSRINESVHDILKRFRSK